MGISLKRNYILNLINTISGMVFPLITFPYASRILQPEGIGIINFYSSIISYISLFVSLGIPLYATREIAKVKEDRELTSITTSEILILNLLLTVIGYFIAVILCFFVPKIREHWDIYLILSTIIFFTTIGCEWFFRGTENFKFITIRGLICRIIYIPLLFIFVKNKNDLLMYAGLTVFVSVGNNLFNFFKITKNINSKYIFHASKKPFKHLKGVLKVFVLEASISLYLQLNIIMLGFLSNNDSVGYYTAASRVTFIISGVIIALQTTLLPRATSLISQNNISQFKETINKIFDFIFCLTLPLSGGLIIMAPLVIKIFVGDEYDPAITTLQILSLNVIISLINGVICGGILVPYGKEKIATYACLAGGIVNLLINFLLIPLFNQNGCAISSLVTELTVGILMVILGYKFIPVRLWKSNYWHYIISTLLMMLLCYYLWMIDAREVYRITVIPISGFIIYSISLFISKDKFFFSIISLIHIKFKSFRKINL